MKLADIKFSTVEIMPGDRLKFGEYWMNEVGYQQFWRLQCFSWTSKGSTRVMWL